MLLRRFATAATALVVSALLPAPAAAQTTISICNRTPQVRDVLMQEVSATDCASVTEEQLAAIEVLDFNGRNLRGGRIEALTPGDLSGLTGVRWMSFINNELETLPAGIFSDMSSLLYLNLCLNRISSLPAGVFDGLEQMPYLILHINELGSLQAGIFAGLSNLEILWLDENPGEPFDFVVRAEQVRPGVGVLRLDKGAPFDISVALSASDGEVSPPTLTLAAGATESAEEFSFTEGAQVSLTLETSVPGTMVEQALEIGPALPQPPPAGDFDPAWRGIRLSAESSIGSAATEDPWPRQALALADTVHKGISRRMQQRATAGGAEVELGGTSDLAALLSARAGAADPVRALKDALRADSGFQLARAATADERSAAGTWSLWGRYSTRDLSGDGWDGDVADLQFGADAQVVPGLLLGVLLSSASGDFSRRAAPNGELELSAWYPWIGWFQPDQYALWLSVGRADAEIDRGNETSCDSRIYAGLIGGNASLLSGPLRLKIGGEVTSVATTAEAAAGCPDIDHGLARGRLTAALSYRLQTESGDLWLPSVELALVRDGIADNNSDLDISVRFRGEIGGNLVWARKGLRLEIGARRLRADRYEESELHLAAHLDLTGADSLGNRISIRPRWGLAADAPGSDLRHEQQQWETGAPVRPGRGLELDWSYRFAAPGATGPWRLFSSLHEGSESRRLKVGAGYDPHPDLQLSLELAAGAEMSVRWSF